MSYFPEIDNAEAIFTEFLATSHTANNSKIIWNTTPRSTGTTGVSIDSSGNITLNGGRNYWLIASMDVTRNSTGRDVEMYWLDSKDNLLDANQGASPIFYKMANSPTSNAAAMFAADVTINTTRTISLKYTLTQSLTINPSMSLLCIELKR